MNLVEYAENELRLAGMYDEDSNYNGMIAKAVVEIVAVFAKQGHSGGSASVVIPVLNKLLQYEPLTALTYKLDEWFAYTDDPLRLQNKRKSSIFSDDGGLTYYDIDDPTNDTRAKP